MRSRTFEHEGGSTHVVVFETGEEASVGLLGFVRERGLTAGAVSAIGGFSRAVVGFFDWETKEYRNIPVDEQVEVLVLAGGVSLKDGEPEVHAHVVLGKADGSTIGGHLMQGEVRPTLEVSITDSPGALVRRHDPESGLDLIDPDAGTAERGAAA